VWVVPAWLVSVPAAAVVVSPVVPAPGRVLSVVSPVPPAGAGMVPAAPEVPAPVVSIAGAAAPLAPPAVVSAVAPFEALLLPPHAAAASTADTIRVEMNALLRMGSPFKLWSRLLFRGPDFATRMPARATVR
jgi:hypothetical protein